MMPEDVVKVDGDETLELEHSQSSLGSDDHIHEQQLDAAPVQKRKGGRKPIYATAEERKQRNRQAQAAFRERRTEYIKQLEITIKDNETKIQGLQQDHSNTAEECQALRQRNVLLEKLLIERGVDVQSELQARDMGRPTKTRVNLGTTSNPRMMQQATMNRHHQARRVPTSLAPKLETHSSNESPIASPQTGVSDSSGHAMSPDSPQIVMSPAVPNGVYPPPPFASHHPYPAQVSSFPERNQPFPAMDGSQYNRQSFDYQHMNVQQHQSATSTPETNSPGITQGSFGYAYPGHDRTQHLGKLSPPFTSEYPIGLCSS